MQNPLADWIKRILPTKPSLPRSIELKAGDHVYVILYDEKHLDRTEMAKVCYRLSQQGIRTIFVGCDDPTRDMTYLAVEPPSPHAVIGDCLLPNHTTP